MSKITQITENMSGFTARSNINEAMKDLTGHTVEELDNIVGGALEGQVLVRRGSTYEPETLHEPTTQPTNVILANDNTAVTPTDDNITWTTAIVDSHWSPEDFDTNWSFNPTLSEYTYEGISPLAHQITASGSITSSGTGNTDHIFARLVEPSGIMTGASKRYAAGLAQGQVTSDIGFTIIGFGLFNTGDVVKVELAKDFASDIVLNDLLIAFHPI